MSCTAAPVFLRRVPSKVPQAYQSPGQRPTESGLTGCKDTEMFYILSTLSVVHALDFTPEGEEQGRQAGTDGGRSLMVTGHGRIA